MGISVEWASPAKKVVRIIYQAGWDWQDFAEHRDRSTAMLASVDYEVPILITFDADASYIPTNALSHITKAFEAPPDNVGLLVVVSQSRLWRLVIGTVQRLIPNSPARNYRLVSSIEEGWELLHDHYGFAENDASV